MMKEQEFITKVENELPRVLPSAFKLGTIRKDAKITNTGNRIDIITSLDNPIVGKPFKIAIEAKDTSRLSSMLEAAYQIKRYTQLTDALPVVAGKFIGGRIREALKNEGVNYFDLAGNSYFNLPNMYIEKIVDKNPFSSTPPLKNIFAPISSRITRAMLIEPKKSWYISDLSKATEVSIGQTYNVLEAMAADKLAQKDDENKWIVSDPTALLNAWKEFYPAYQTRRYSFFSYLPNEKIRAAVVAAGAKTGVEYALGFFSGADLIAPYIRGLSKVQLYTTGEAIETWKKELDLKEVDNYGNVELYVPYDKGVFYGVQDYKLDDGTTAKVASNTQLYMDLFNNPARGEEAAEYLRKMRIGY
jgi:hypothetical protein